MKSCLVVSRAGQIAGAERIAARLYEDLKDKYQINLVLTTLRPRGPLTQKIPTVGWWKIFLSRPRIIHSHLFLPGIMVGLRRLFDRSFVWVHTLHYVDYRDQKLPWLRRWLDRRLVLKRADRVVAVSPSVYGRIADLPNACLIENTIKLSDQGRPNHSGELVLGAVAMLRAEKGLDELLLAMPKIVERYPRIKLRIAGDGPELRRLRQRIATLNLERNVELLGYVSDIEGFYRSLDLFISPSRTESFGIAVLEAMQFQLPIVAAAVDALPELLGGGRYGCLVERGPNFVNDLSLAVLQVLEDRGVWSARAREGLRHHRARLDAAVMSTRYQTLFEELTKAGICMVAPIVTQATGGIQRQLFLQSRELAQRGFRVFVLQRRDSNFGSNTEKWSHVEFLWTPDILHKAFENARWAQRARGGLFIFFGFLQIARHRREIQIIHGHQLFSPALLGALAKACFGMALVVKVTASGELGERNELKRLPFKRLRRLAFRSIDRLIVLTEEMRQEMLGLGFRPERIELISNSVQLPEASRANQPFGGDVLRVLYCGRLSEEKCLHNLIEAAAKLGRRGIRTRVDLVGGAYGGRDTTDQLKILAERLKADTEVRFHGSQSDVATFYMNADVFVLPSQSEGMSNALLEALSFAVPVIASDIQANRFVISDGDNGLLFRQGDSDDLASKLELLAMDQKSSGELSLRLARRGLETVRARFSTQAIGGKLESLYGAVL